uniref:Arabidopsis retrotransposon Orf1 C-terminal domain-containing protein n=1 Tax=Chenopodium quinoa TaxID=63459 RepID=A0A803MAN2_CHEQI
MSPANHIRHPALRYVQRLLVNTIFGRQEGSKARKDELFMICQMLHAQPIDTGLKERLLKEESIEGTDCIDIPACSLMGWIRKKDGTTLWCIQNDEDELPSREALSLRDKTNWSFNGVHPRTRTQILPKLVLAPYVSNGASSSSTPIEKALADLHTSIDKINNEQREIKEQLVLISNFLGTLSTWIQSGGSQNLPRFPPQ